MPAYDSATKVDSGDNKNGTQGSADFRTLGSNIATSALGEFRKGPSVYDKTLYTGLGPQTQQGLDWTRTAAQNNAPGLYDAYNANSALINNGGFGAGQRNAMRSVNDILAESGREAPGYAQLRKSLKNDVLSTVGEQFSGSGRFGGGGYVDTATDQLADSLGALDYQRYNDGLNRTLAAASTKFGMGQQATANLGAANAAAGGLYQNTLLPGQALTGIGQVQDADAQAQRLGDFELFGRESNAGFDNVARYMSLLNAGQGQNGIEQETPWWQQALGGAIGLAGAFL